MTQEEKYNRFIQLQKESDCHILTITKLLEEDARLVKQLSHAQEFINRLNEEFEQKTSLNGKDWSFLVLATIIQCIRIYGIPYLKTLFEQHFTQKDFHPSERLDHDAQEIKDMEKSGLNKLKEKTGGWENIKSAKHSKTWHDMAFNGVPYDVTKHSNNKPADYSGDAEFFGINMHGGLHRVKTLGHDPILGWIFGTVNIITDTITIVPEVAERNTVIPIPLTFNVGLIGNTKCWTSQTTTTGTFIDAISSVYEDKHRLYAALFAQGMHIASDKYTHEGLPIPFLTLANPDEAYRKYSEGIEYLGWEKENFWKIKLGKISSEMAMSMLINKMISYIHLLFYNPDKDGTLDLFKVKDRKVIDYSNALATGSDIIQASIRTYFGDGKAFANLDWGGLIVTIYRLFTDYRLNMEIKREFIESGIIEKLTYNENK